MVISPIIGLEIHVQLKTNSKMFCSCDANYFGSEPNTHMCPTCLGLPGGLPTANRKALENAIKVGHILNCTINPFSKFDRKNYMYPDLFKGYQITQYEIPICEHGHVLIDRSDKTQLRVGITRAHQEEDTAKSIHEKTYTLVDGNKAGVPLLEIVSEPDIFSVEDAILYAEYVYATLRFVGVSDCNMEKGQMRFDVNVNLQLQDEHDGITETIATPIVEIKNLNSFRSMERALRYEIERQEEEYNHSKISLTKGNKTTRGWSDAKDETYLLRSKEEAEDYRYFPEPDIPPVLFTTEEIERLRSEIGKIPSEIYTEFVEFGLQEDTARFFSVSRAFYEYFEKARHHYHDMKNLANWIKSDLVYAITQKDITIDVLHTDLENYVKVHQLLELLQVIDEKVISISTGKELLALLINTDISPKAYIQEKGLTQISDTDVLTTAIQKVLVENESAVSNIKQGKTSAIMFLVGQVMKEMKGKGNPGLIKEMIEKTLQ